MATGGVGFAVLSVLTYAREGHEVKSVEVPRLGHQWASGQNVNATIWQFFAAHPLAE